MDPSFLLPLLVSWITHKFPSLSEYAEYITPAVFFVFAAIGIFTNLLPEPNHKYPIPDVADLELQLQGGGGFILKIAKFTRSLTITVNWFIATAVYSWFYSSANSVSKFLPRFKKKEAGVLTSKK